MFCCWEQQNVDNGLALLDDTSPGQPSAHLFFGHMPILITDELSKDLSFVLGF